MATDKLNITVLGAGIIGRTIGRKWLAAGHAVTFGVTNPDGKNAQTVRSELGEQVSIGEAKNVLSSKSDVVLMALPGNAMDEAIATYASELDGKIIIDAANRMGGGAMNSLATFQAKTPAAQVYRAFNTLGWENFADPVFNGVTADLFYAGPDGASRGTVEQLITDVGLQPIWLGGYDQVGLVDSIAGLWFALAFGQKKGRNMAFKVLTR